MSGFEIVAAIATPPGLFTACLQCFDLIKAGRDFGKDYERSLIRLRAAHLRLVRWGETVGLAVRDLSTPVPTRISNTPSEETTAKDHLAAILVDLAEVSKMCSQYDSNRNPAKANDENNGNLESASVTPGGGALVLRELKERMQGQASERQRTTTLVHKLTWVCHGKKKLDQLIQNINESIDNLGNLSQAPQVEHEQPTRSETDTEAGVTLEDAEGTSRPKGTSEDRSDQPGHRYLENLLEKSEDVTYGDTIITAASTSQASVHIYEKNRAICSKGIRYGNVFQGS